MQIATSQGSTLSQAGEPQKTMRFDLLGLPRAPFTGLIVALILSFEPLHADDLAFEVPFLTVRNLADGDGPTAFFGDQRSNLRAGWCEVGNVELGGLAPLADAIPRAMREQLLRVDRVRVMDPGNLLDDLQGGADASLSSLYVHGYLIGFEKGCRRAGLFKQNAGLDDGLLWFTWPSDGDVASYTVDESDLYWSIPDLADAIIELDRRSASGEGIAVIGHSLGARGVVLALREVAYRKPDIRLDEVVLLAADMDFGIFAKTLPLISQVVENITIYVSDDDRPLALSAQLHGYARLGQSNNDFARLSGVEVIDLRVLPSETPSGHLYHIHSAAVGQDLDLLLNKKLRAHERPNLTPSGPNTWVLRP